MSGELILVIDDSREIIRHITERLLPTFGFKSLYATDGRSGLDLIRREKPDLVMLDLNLPEMTGLDVLQRLAYESIEIPVVLMTGYGSEKSAIEAFRLGVRDYLIKPFTVDEVLETINRALMEKRLRQDKEKLTGELRRSNAEVRRRLNETETLLSVGKTLATLRSRDQVIEHILESAIYVTNAEESTLWLLAPDSNMMQAYGRTASGEEMSPPPQLTTDHPLITQVIREGQVLRESMFSGPGIKIRTGYTARSLVYVPLTLRGSSMGVLGVTNRSAPRAFSEREEMMLSKVAEFAAIALDNARSFQSVAPATTLDGGRLAQLSQAVAAAPGLNDAVRLIIKTVTETWRVEAASLWLLNETRQTLRCLANLGVSFDVLSQIELRLGQGLVGHVARTGKWVYTNDAKSHPLHLAEVDERTGFATRSLLAVPLFWHRKVIGVLELVNKQGGDFSEEEAMGAVEVAATVSAALANALLQKQVESRQLQLEALLANMDLTVLVLDEEMQLISFSAQARELLGLDRSALGRPAREVIRQEALIALLEQPLEPAAAQRTEIALAEGLVAQCTLVAVPRYGRVLLLRDVTLLKQMDGLKADFVATVSHDLRAPLTSVMEFARALSSRGGLDQEQQLFARHIEEASERMLSLVNDLLDLARISNRLDQTRVPCQMAPLLLEATMDVQGRMLQKQVELVTEVEDGLPPVFCDPEQLRQAIGNLLDNAVKFSPAGSRVEVEVKRAGDTVRVRVSDSGPGIPPAEVGLVFDRFYRGKAHRDVEGSGLGLALVRSIMEAHGGRAWAESEAGAGSTFWLELPAFKKPAPAPQALSGEQGS